MQIDWKYALTSFEGRLNRQPYWIANIALLAVSMLVQFVLLSIANMAASILVSLVFIYPAYALLVKRGYDRDRPALIAQIFFGIVVLANLMQLFGLSGPPENPSAPFMMLGVVILVSVIYILVDYGCLRGTVGPNRYGPDPLGGQS